MPPPAAAPLAAILRQPDVAIEGLSVFWPRLTEMPADVLEEAQTQMKYAGYLERQAELVERSVITSYSIHYTKLYDACSCTASPGNLSTWSRWPGPWRSWAIR